MMIKVPDSKRRLPVPKCRQNRFVMVIRGITVDHYRLCTETRKGRRRLRAIKYQSKGRHKYRLLVGQ